MNAAASKHLDFSESSGALMRHPFQCHLRLTLERPNPGIEAQARHKNELTSAVEQRSEAVPFGNAGGLVLLLEASWRAAETGLEPLRTLSWFDLKMPEPSQWHASRF